MHNQRDKKQKLKLLFSGTFILLLAFSILISEGCDPGETLTTSETNVVVTNYDKGFDFTAKSTFSLPDKVQVIDASEEDPEPLPPELNNAILQTTENEMTLRGYVLEADPENNPPDLEITIFATTSDVYGASGGYCWYYYGYCYWYRPPYVYYAYSTGTVFTHMSDPTAEEVDEGSLPVWDAGLNGVLGSSTSDDINRVKQMIQQSFDQSPYLTAN